MKIIDLLIYRLGISQRVLAKFVDSDHSHLSRYRANTRSLPTAAIPQLSALYRIVSELPLPEPAAPDDTILSFIHEKRAWCQLRCKLLERKLSAMQKRYSQASTLSQVLRVYESENQNMPDDKRRWLAEQRYQAEKLKGETNWIAQKEFQIRLSLLQQEAVLWEKTLAEQDVVS